jgi:hypothetical protein
MMDEPSDVRNDQTETSVDGALALAFHGSGCSRAAVRVAY